MGEFHLDTLARAWSRTGTQAKQAKTHIARSEGASRAICGAPVVVALQGGVIPDHHVCGSCATVWESRMRAIEADPWEVW